MFDPVKKVKRIKRNYSLGEDTVRNLNRLAKRYNTTQSAIIDALIATYGDDLMEKEI